MGPGPGPGQWLLADDVPVLRGRQAERVFAGVSFPGIAA